MRFACAKIRTISRLIYKVIYGSTVVVCLLVSFSIQLLSGSFPFSQEKTLRVLYINDISVYEIFLLIKKAWNHPLLALLLGYRQVTLSTTSNE